jgi:FtsH-binding integral membrane protein
MSIAALAGCAWLARRPFFQALLLIQIGTWIGSLAVSYTLMQFETRYLFIGKSLAFFSALAVVAALIHDRRDRQLLHSPAVPDQSPRA